MRRWIQILLEAQLSLHDSDMEQMTLKLLQQIKYSITIILIPLHMYASYCNRGLILWCVTIRKLIIFIYVIQFTKLFITEGEINANISLVSITGNITTKTQQNPKPLLKVHEKTAQWFNCSTLVYLFYYFHACILAWCKY